VRYQRRSVRFKIYAIDEVHQVTKDAFNALLKTLEEPPPSVKFILATTEPHRLPETILSRCQRYDFRRIPLREIVHRLDEISKREGLK
jgi:DNA polymerase-3 subunit gamma/tau